MSWPRIKCSGPCRLVRRAMKTLGDRAFHVVSTVRGSSGSLRLGSTCCTQGRQAIDHCEIQSVACARVLQCETYLGIIQRRIRFAVSLWPMLAKPEKNSLNPMKKTMSISTRPHLFRLKDTYSTATSCSESSPTQSMRPVARSRQSSQQPPSHQSTTTQVPS